MRTAFCKSISHHVPQVHSPTALNNTGMTFKRHHWRYAIEKVSVKLFVMESLARLVDGNLTFVKNALPSARLHFEIERVLRRAVNAKFDMFQYLLYIRQTGGTHEE